MSAPAFTPSRKRPNAKRISEMDAEELNAALRELRVSYGRRCNNATSGQGSGFRKAAFKRNEQRYVDALRRLNGKES